MRLRSAINFACLLFATTTFGQPAADITKFSALTLTDSIKQNADAVYRLDEGSLEIISPAKYKYKLHNIVTLLNKDAANHLNHTFHYSKFEKVENVEIKIYNSAGMLQKRFTKKDFETRNYDDRMSVFTDDKLLTLETVAPEYPCTVESSYELSTTGYINLPSWLFVSPDEAVENSKFTVKVPAALNIRYKSVSTSIKPEITTEGDSKIYSWTAANIHAPKKVEYDGYDASTYYPRIELAPEQFEYDGFKGELNTWQGFGAWNYQFYEDNKAFTNEQAEELKNAVASCKNDKEKIAVLYKWLQNSMRYVSIQLGIGGFKPFPVQFVHDKQYGDCKALTNYMRYMLKAVGINSYPALINAGYNKAPANPAFPTDVFNHVILCVPLQKDSVWLECTSNFSDCGVLGSFTENKNALLLTENGGVLVQTPKSICSENTLTTKTVISLNADGGSKAKTNISYTGDFWEKFYQLSQLNQDEQKNLFVNKMEYKTPDEFQFTSDNNKSNFTINASYEQQYDFKAGEKYFCPQKIYKLFDEQLSMNTKREHDYVFHFPYTKTDTTIYILPVGTIVESLPSKADISNKYLSYKNEFIQNASDHSITIIAELSLKKQVIPATEYADFLETASQIAENEKKKIVLKKG